MQPDLDDIGGAKELALYRIGAAKEDLEAAEKSFESGHFRASNNRAYMQYLGRYQLVWH